MTTKDHANKTYIALGDDGLQKSAEALRTILANTIYMYQLYKNYHWHVAGKDFYNYHLLFDKHASEQLPTIDLVAERLRTLGLNTPGMPEDVLKNKSIDTDITSTHEPENMIASLLIAHQDYIAKVREAITLTSENGDEGTNDMLVGDVLRVHELETWFIRSCLEPRQVTH